jgi:hypothetical protein
MYGLRVIHARDGTRVMLVETVVCTSKITATKFLKVQLVMIWKPLTC